MKTLGTLLIALATASLALAGNNQAPEIDANTAGSAIALVSGGLLVLRSRKK